jgi:hypothetical protein
VTITDRRVVFQGPRKTREWLFTKLLGYQHQVDAPWTAIQVSNRQATSGVLYTPATGADFQFRLAAGVAAANGTIESLVASLEDEQHEHVGSRPVLPDAAPPPSLPDARGAALAARVGALPTKGKVAIAVAAVFLLVAAIPEGADDEGDARRDVQLAEQVADEVTTTAPIPSSTTTTAAPTTTTAPPTTTTTVVVTTLPPPPPTTAPPVTVAPVAAVTRSDSSCDPNYADGCVPVASDVDCAGGSGNGPAYVTGPVRVIGVDVYDLDRDGDGWGCDS